MMIDYLQLISFGLLEASQSQADRRYAWICAVHHSFHNSTARILTFPLVSSLSTTILPNIPSCTESCTLRDDVARHVSISNALWSRSASILWLKDVATGLQTRVCRTLEICCRSPSIALYMIVSSTSDSPPTKCLPRYQVTSLC